MGRLPGVRPARRAGGTRLLRPAGRLLVGARWRILLLPAAWPWPPRSPASARCARRCAYYAAPFDPINSRRPARPRATTLSTVPTTPLGSDTGPARSATHATVTNIKSSGSGPIRIQQSNRDLRESRG
jgi:hypothetical protein